MMNIYYIEIINELIRALEELKKSTLISKTFHKELEQTVRELTGDINFWLNAEVRKIKCEK